MRPYNTLSDYLKARFGCRVFKVSLNAGLTCPNRDGTKGRGGCTYCEPETLAPPGFDPRQSIRAQLDGNIERVRARHNAEKFIAYFQINTSTHAPLDYLERIYSEALGAPGVAGIVVSTRPDCLGEGVLDLLSSLGDRLLWAELGLQTSNDATLARVNRGHTAAEFAHAVERARHRGIDVCAHMIIGLPGEGADDVIGTAEFLARLGVWGVKFHQMQVIRSTELERQYERGAFVLPGLEDYARFVVECLLRLPPASVIHRLSGDVPDRYLVAPRWGANKFIIAERVIGLMRERGARQGDMYRGGSATGFL
ncbi:MAG: TIGR01212 family radical SAM protein [Thermodesulfobacteriota bacterium]